MPQLQHNMWVVAARTAVLSVITGGGKWVEIATHADQILYALEMLDRPKPQERGAHFWFGRERRIERE
jgi:hypothetical protein